MKSIKMALLGGAALAVTTAGAAKADDLADLKAQIEALNTRVAAMEAAPSVPAGYQLLAVSGGSLEQTPGLPMDTHQLAGYGNKATFISVMPTADAPAGTTISWSGYARAGLIYNSYNTDVNIKTDNWIDRNGNNLTGKRSFNLNGFTDDDTDVTARGQIRVKAKTDTAVGEVGVDIRLRANFNGNGGAEVYSDVAWGYWSMTPEVTFGGGYAGSLGKIGYGYDGACTCYLTDSADVAFDPGDVTQFRLSYGSGPFSMAVALEDGSQNSAFVGESDNSVTHGDKLGAAGEIKYTGDTVSGEVSGVWRDKDDNSDAGYTDLWQVGAGIGFTILDGVSASIGAAAGEGPFQTTSEGTITNSLPYNQQWWGVSALLGADLTDVIHAEIAAGYKNREGDSFDYYNGSFNSSSNGVNYETWAVLGGVYYNPVDQLTIGVEAEYYTTSTDFKLEQAGGGVAKVNDDKDTLTVDLVSLWRF